MRLVGGLRPAALTVLGIGWIVYGRSISTDPNYGRTRGLAGITQYVPMGALGWVWVAAGVVALLAGLLRLGIQAQAIGFAAVAAPAVLWGVTFLRSAWNGTYPAASGSAAVWIAVGVSIVLTAGMAEPGWVIDALYDKSKRGAGNGR